MANMCFYDGIVYGDVSDVEKFHKYLYELNDDNVTLWNFVEILSDACTEKEDKRIGNFRFCGEAKCSFKSSFIDAMPAELTICNIAKKFNVNFEIYSEECGIDFQEYICVDSKGNASCECVDWLELLVQDCKTYAEWTLNYNNDTYYLEYIKKSSYLTECARGIAEDNNLVDINITPIINVADSVLEFLFNEAVNSDSLDAYHFCLGGYPNWDFFKYEDFKLDA